jgi:hypothetical protein
MYVRLWLGFQCCPFCSWQLAGWPRLPAPLLVFVDSIPCGGCPVLSRSVRKGGQHRPQTLKLIRRWFPPLQRTQGWGTLIRGGARVQEFEGGPPALDVNPDVPVYVLTVSPMLTEEGGAFTGRKLAPVDR